MKNKALSVATATLPEHRGGAARPQTGDRLDQFLQQWLEDDALGGGTVSDILQHPQVKKHGFFGRLNTQQQSLVTSVVSIMQDRSARDARHHANTLRQIVVAEREALKSLSGSFAETARSLYRLPLLGASRREQPVDIIAEPIEYTSAGAGAGAPPEPPSTGGAATAPTSASSPGFLQRYLTWGNLIAGTALVLAVLVVKTSVETANFETQYQHTQAQLAETSAALKVLKDDYRELEATHRALGERHAGALVRLEETEKQWLSAQMRAETEHEQWQVELNQLRDALEQERVNGAAVQMTLRNDIAALEQTLAVYKSKETHQDEHYQLWKRLAEERQQEITRLQSEIVALATIKPEPVQESAKAPTEEAPSRGRFFGFF